MNKNVLMLLLAVVLIFTSCNFNQKHNETRGIENGHNYVDLGLPSGTKWATCNVGAEKPEDFGDYYHLSGRQEYDAARANWGGQWRTPTVDEFDELKLKCIWTWTMSNGVSGYKIQGMNGDSIFLPAAGWIDGNECLGSSLQGRYLRVDYYDEFSPMLDYSFIALSSSWALIHLDFGNWGYYFNDDYDISYYGMSVRPVCK